MQIVVDAVLPFPPDRVFRAYRDDVAKLLAYLPNVRSIEVKSRVDEPPVTRIVNVWHGGGEIPAAARAVLSESMLSWTDHAEWNAEELACRFRVETHAFTEAVRCEGESRVYEASGGTRLEVRGELAIDVSRVRGVPRLLAGRVGSAVTDLLTKRITANLHEVSRGLERMLGQGDGA